MEQMHGIFEEEMPNAEEETSSDIQATIRLDQLMIICDFSDFSYFATMLLMYLYCRSYSNIDQFLLQTLTFDSFKYVV